MLIPIVIFNEYGNDILGKSAYREIPPSARINGIIEAVIENHLEDNNTVYPPSVARGVLSSALRVLRNAPTLRKNRW